MEAFLKKKLKGGAFVGVSVERSQAMAAIRGKNTKSTEVALRMALVRSGVSGWSLHKPNLPGKPDLFFPDAKLVVFVDGCFWHGCCRCGHVPKTRRSFWRAKIMRNVERDRRNTHTLRAMGFRVIRIWEHSLGKKKTTGEVLQRITRLLDVQKDNGLQA